MYHAEMQNRVIFELQQRKLKGVSSNGGTLGGVSFRVSSSVVARFLKSPLFCLLA